MFGISIRGVQAHEDDQMESCLHPEAEYEHANFPEVEGMRAIFSSARIGWLGSHVGLEAHQTESEEEQSAQANPPLQGEVKAFLRDDHLVHCEETEQDRHCESGEHSVDSEGFSVAILVWTHMVDGHGLS